MLSRPAAHARAPNRRSSRLTGWRLQRVERHRLIGTLRVTASDAFSSLLAQMQLGLRQSEVVRRDAVVMLPQDRVGLDLRKPLAFLRKLAKTFCSLQSRRHANFLTVARLSAAEHQLWLPSRPRLENA